MPQGEAAGLLRNAKSAEQQFGAQCSYRGAIFWYMKMRRDLDSSKNDPVFRVASDAIANILAAARETSS